ncbi:DUF4232 domain-containing protein [Streptomyces sp. NBC_01525]|uniref:DUF4232 domain-containing protein n=1 Tax=Streptomyces sp. NBC_01525 TaxID=2903893 RepID=UPI003866ED33
MRTSRIRATVLAAATATLALSLTACGGGDTGTKSDAGAPQSQSASGGDAKGGTAQANSGKDAKDDTRSTSASGGTGTAADKGGDTADARQCVGDELMVTAEHRFAGQQGDHLLITASNEGSKPCWVTSYPSVKLGDVDAVLPHSKKDNPGGGQQITLRPGGKVYSAVNLFDYGSKNHSATSFAMGLRDRNGHVGPEYSVDAKGGSKFTWNEADVLNWNTKKPYDF